MYVFFCNAVSFCCVFLLWCYGFVVADLNWLCFVGFAVFFFSYFCVFVFAVMLSYFVVVTFLGFGVACFTSCVFGFIVVLYDLLCTVAEKCN